MKPLLVVKKQGLFCSAGNFFIDAWAPVPLSIVTHAHGDHASPGHGKHLWTHASLELLKYRLGQEAPVQSYPYGEKFRLNDSWVSFHPAGHILGSAQIRVESEGQVCVVSGDYKRVSDLTCDPFELVKCDIFVTESTFGLPIYKWEPSEITVQKIYQWWMENRSRGMCSVL